MPPPPQKKSIIKIQCKILLAVPLRVMGMVLVLQNTPTLSRVFAIAEVKKIPLLSLFFSFLVLYVKSKRCMGNVDEN